MSSGPSPIGDVPKQGMFTVVALKIKPLFVLVIVGAIIGVLVVFGILQRVSFPYWGTANLDSEVSVATWFSASLLWLASVSWLLVAANAGPRSGVLWLWGLILAWLALDEGNAVHERLERWTGVDWQLLYIPVMAVAATTWVLVVRRFRFDRRIIGLFVGTAVAWGIALVLELVQNWGGAPVRASLYDPAMIVEEGLEMVGTLLVLIAAMLALRVVTTERLS